MYSDGELRDVVSSAFDQDAADTNGPTPNNTLGTIDVWIVGSWDWEDLGRTLSLLLQLAHIIHEKKQWKKQTKIRLLQVIDPETSIDGRSKVAGGILQSPIGSPAVLPRFLGADDESKEESGEPDVDSTTRTQLFSHFVEGQNVRIQLVCMRLVFLLAAMIADVSHVTYNMFF